MYIYFLSLAICQLIESWMGVLVVYTQHWLCTHRHTHTDARYRARRNTVVFSNQTDSKLENKHLGPSMTSCFLFLHVPTQKDAAALIQSFFGATAHSCLDSIDQGSFRVLLYVIKYLEATTQICKA